MKPQRKTIARRVFHPGLSDFLRTPEVAGAETDELEIVRAILRIRPHGQIVRDPRLFEPSDVQTNRRHPIVGTVEIRLRRQHPFERRDRFSVLEILRRTPEDRRPGPMALGQRGFQVERPLAVVFRLLQPYPL
jgi:hypothetical protein